MALALRYFLHKSSREPHSSHLLHSIHELDAIARRADEISQSYHYVSVLAVLRDPPTRTRRSPQDSSAYRDIVKEKKWSAIEPLRQTIHKAENISNW
jgi:hypothetical protein